MGKSQKPSEMDPKDLPEGRAFEDEFTKGFIQSTEEVSPGDYPLLSKNERFEMAFPKEDLTASEQYVSKDNFESISFNDWKEGKDTSSSVNVDFHSYFKPGDIDTK